MRNRGNRTVTRWVWVCMCTASFLAGTAAWAFARPLHLKLVDANDANLLGATIIASSEASKPMTAIAEADGTYTVDIAGSKISLVVQQPALGQKQTVQFALTDMPPGPAPVSVKLRYNGQSLTRIMPNNAKPAAAAAPVSLGTLSGFISTKKASPGAGAPKISPSSIQLPPSPPGPAGGGCGALTITQNTDPITIVAGTSVSCNAAGVNVDNWYARSFDLSVGPTAGVPWTVGCVDFGVETNVLPYTVTVNIYEDTNGGAPDVPVGDLVLLGTMPLAIPDGTALTVVTADFTTQGIVLPADSTVVFEVFTPDRQVTDNGSFFVGSNSAGQSGPTYLKAPVCSVTTYTDTAAIGFPLMHWVMRVDLNSTGPIFGACCDDVTGICTDNVLSTDCLGRFAANTLCANLSPPCGVVLGACCLPDGTCSLTEQANCAGTWLGANTTCAAGCPLANDDCANASPIAGAGTFAFDNSTATTDGAPDPLCFAFGTDQIDNDVWFCWTAPECAGSDVTITTVGLTAVDTRIAVYAGCSCPPTTILACNDDDPADGLQSTVTFPATGQPYLIRIGTFPGAAGGVGSFDITCAAPPGPPNDLCADAICVADGSPFSGSTVNATGTDISSCASGDTADVWHIYTPGVTGPATISLCGSAFDTTLSVFDACGGAELACNDDSCGLQSEITALNLTAGTPILIRVSGFGGGTGDYTLTVTGGAGTCGACPPGGSGDECGAPIVVGEGTFAGDTSDNTGSTGDDTSCAFNDTIDEWYCYTATCTGTATANTCDPATAFDTSLAVFDACGGAEIACNDDTCGLQSEVTWPVTAGVSYFIRVSGFNDAVGAYTLLITCQAGPPPPQGICTEPAANCQAGDLSNANTSDVVGFVVADDFNCPGPGSITSICWWGTYLSGAPSPDSFTVTYYDDAGGMPGSIIGGPFTGAGLTVAGPVDTGMIIAGLVPEFEYTATHAAVPVIGACYWVSVTNALASGDTWFWEFGLGNGRAMQDGLPAGGPNGFDAGDLIQNDLKWCLNLALGDPTACLPPPAGNDDCANAEPIAGEGTFPFDNSAATTDGLPDPLCDFFAAQQIDSDVWFCWTAPCTSDVRVETCNLTGVDTKIAVYDGCTCPTGNGILACNDDDCGLQSGLVFSAVAGQSYLIRIGTFPGAAGGVGSFNIACIQLPANDLCADAIGPLAVPSTTAGTTALATIDSGFPSPCGSASITSPGVWYTVLGTGNTMTASLCNGATNFDSKLSIFCRGCAAAICVDGNDDFCGLQSEVSWCSQAGVEYLILVHGFGGANGPFELVLTDDGTACVGAVQCIVEPTGACCAADGTCTLQTASGCAASGGAFLGDGTDCGSESTVASATSTPGLAIPDNDPIGVSDTLMMGGSFSIQDVNISLDVTHTWVGDLIVTVDHLGMTAVTIVDQPGVPNSTFGCSEDNYNIVLDDEGTGGAIEDQCAPGLSSPPNYTPNNPLSAFDGMDSAGAWTITISDNAGGDLGSLNAWTVTFTQPGVNPCGVVGACCVGATCSIETDINCAAIGGAFQGAGTDCGGLVVVASPSSSPGLAIPDSDPLGVSDTLTMGMSIPIEVVQINLVATHTWVGDLIFTVEHLGTSVTIVDRPGTPPGTFGCSEDNYNIVLDDAGTGGAIEDQCAPNLTSPPNYTPNNPLSAFAGMDSAGDWTITVSDNAGGDLGTLDSWSVIFLQSSGGPCAGPTCTPADCPAGSIPLVDGQTGLFSGWCVTPSNPGDVDIFVDTVDLAGGLVSIEITKSFRNPPDANGLIPPILLNFVQVCDDADTVNMIVIAEEAVNNQTGVAWTDYHWTLFTSPVSWFDVGASAGFSVAPFADRTFNNFLDPPTNNQAKGLDASGGGTVPSPGAFFPGFGTGGLKIGVDLSGAVPVSFTLKQRPTVGAPAVTGACCLPPAPDCLGNGSFESGDFTNWTTQDLGNPFVPLHVGGAGESPGFGLFTSAPTDGTSALLTGFDGDGPGTIRVAQDASIPAGATALLFDYRGGWDLATFGATQDRTFTVKIEPAGGGAALQTDLILTAVAGTFMGDTGPLNGSVDVSAFAGSTVQVAFEWFVPELFSGPAFFQLDNVRCDLSGSPCMELTAADCLAAGGVFQGDGVSCTPNPCLPPPPPGACCTIGVCTMTATMDDCTAAGGTFQGAGTSCADCFICGVPPLSNDLCADAIPVAVPSQTEGTTVGATLDGVPFCGTSETSPSVWYSVTGTGNTMTATTCNACSDYDTKISVYCAGCATLNCVDGNDDNCTGFSGLLSTVSWCSEAGTEYLILVHGFGGAEGNFRLDVSDDGVSCATPPSCAPPPMCAADFVVTAPGTFPGDTTGAGNDCDLRATEEHIYEVTLPNAGTWTFSLCGSAFDTFLHVGTTCCSNDIASNDDFCGLQSEITTTLPAGTVWVTVEGFSGAGAYTLNISKQAAQTNDDCINAEAIAGVGTFPFDNSAATTDGQPDPLCDAFGSQVIDNDVWFCWTATCTGSATVETCALTAVDTKIAAYDGCVCPPTTILACNDDTCGLQSQITFPVVAGQTYLLRIGTFPGASGGTGSILVSCTAGGVQSTPSISPPGLDIKPGIAPNPFAAQSNGLLPVGILGTTDFNVATVNVASLRIARLDGAGGLVAPYQGAVGPQTAIGEIGTPDGFADLSVYFRTSEMAGALKLGTLPVGTTVPLIVTGSRTDGAVFKVVDSIVTAPLTKGRKFVTVTSSVPGAWIDAGGLDTNADAGGFASFVRCYGDLSYVTTFTAPASANQKAFRNWVMDGVAQPLGVRTIQVPLSGDHTVRAQYLIRRPRRAPTEIERGGLGPTP